MLNTGRIDGFVLDERVAGAEVLNIKQAVIEKGILLHDIINGIRFQEQAIRAIVIGGIVRANRIVACRAYENTINAAVAAIATELITGAGQNNSSSNVVAAFIAGEFIVITVRKEFDAMSIAL